MNETPHTVTWTDDTAITVANYDAARAAVLARFPGAAFDPHPETARVLAFYQPRGERFPRAVASIRVSK